ncbi:hypothetical protein M0P98_07025 [bacterium]|nr:hypothetical protein [bacterium]
MQKERLRDRKERFTINKKGTLEDNIKKLESELEVTSSGAPKVYDKIEDYEKAKLKEEKKREQQTEVEEETIPPEPTYTPPVSRPSYSYSQSSQQDRGKSVFKNSKFYITIIVIIVAGLALTKAPIFQYLTPFRHDKDFPHIQVAFKYYNNLLGKQKKQATILKDDVKTVLVPIPMQQWVNLDANKKQIVLNEYFGSED